MAHAVLEHETKAHMGLPLPHGKLAMWLFLVTEIMFFTGLIGTYIIYRSGQPTVSNPWPGPHDVHLVELIGAMNTLVLIVSSFTVVLAHYYLHHGNSKRAAQMIGITLALGCVFLAVKAIEYKSKFDHGILPGRVWEGLDTPRGYAFIRHVEKQLEDIKAQKSVNARKSVNAEAMPLVESLLQDIKDKKLSPRQVNERVLGTATMLKKGENYVDLPEEAKQKGRAPVKGILELDKHAHLSYSIPWGNMWASCYFAMTGFHAIHVLGGLVIFVIMLIMHWRGNFGRQHESLVEYTGLYWHFVDIVWIFLFPLLYLV